MYTEYSVLMSVYSKEKPHYLEQAMDSIWMQTMQTNDFVLVCDGPLTNDLNEVIARMETHYGDRLTVVRLSENGGLGRALNAGIKYCKNELVARMDSDDISRPGRCESQLNIFNENEMISIVSGTVEEFSETKEIIEARRVLPEKHAEIIKFAKKRNPFNHPCVMYKKSEVEAAGGYKDFYLLEDYYLWVRMIQNGAIGYNVKKPLLWMRAGSEMYMRRAGSKYAQSQRKLFKYMRKTHFIGFPQYLISITTRSVSASIPNQFREQMYKLFVRK